MRVHKTFPKDGVKKDRETIRDLKAELRKKEKEIRFLRSEIDNLVKPVRDRKPQIAKKIQTVDEWRKDFIRRFAREVLGKEG